MKHPLYFLLPGLIFFFSSCSKKKETTYSPWTAVVRTVSHSQSGISEAYSYDGQNRVTLIHNSDGSKSTFAYDSALITQTNYDGSGAILSTYLMPLDTMGHATSAEIRDAADNVQGYHIYSFDPWGYQRSDETYNEHHDIAGKTVWVWGDGNLTNYAIYDSAAANKIYDTYCWYYDPAVTSAGNANKGQKFKGNDSKYLIRKAVRHSYLYGDLVYTYEYSFDDQQRITEAKTFDYHGNLKNTDSYTYY